MKNMKRIITTATVIGMITAAGAVYAANTTDNTNTVAAKASAELEALKAQRLEQRKAILDQRVAEGRLTQEQADLLYKTMKDNQAECDGTGSMGAGKRSGEGSGICNGQGMGQGKGQGMGRGVGAQGCGAGMGAGRGMMNR